MFRLSKVEYPGVGIYKRKKKVRKQELGNESDQENKNSIKKKKKKLFFLITFCVEFLFSFINSHLSVRDQHFLSTSLPNQLSQLMQADQIRLKIITPKIGIALTLVRGPSCQIRFFRISMKNWVDTISRPIR